MIVTVLMSVHNGAAYLPAAVESILRQTWQEFEFLIIDDASSDATPALLAHYAQQDPRIRLVRNPSNLGLTKSLNLGLKAAQGRYIARQDADDIALPTRLAQQMAFLEAHPQTVLVAAELDRINAAGEIIGKQRRAADPAFIRWGMMFYNYLGGHSVVMFRREAALEGYNETYPYSQDYELWLRLMTVGEVAILPQVLLHLRQHEQNISHQKASEQEQLSLQLSQRALAALGVAPLSLEEIAQLRAFWLEPFPSAGLAPLLQHHLRQIFAAFCRQSPHLDSSPIKRRIAAQFMAWARAISLRQQPRTKLRLWRYASQWWG